jgi:hypothetical protein
MHLREHIGQDEEAASRLAPKGDDSRFNFSIAMNGRSDWYYFE